MKLPAMRKGFDVIYCGRHPELTRGKSYTVQQTPNTHLTLLDDKTRYIDVYKHYCYADTQDRVKVGSCVMCMDDIDTEYPNGYSPYLKEHELFIVKNFRKYTGVGTYGCPRVCYEVVAAKPENLKLQIPAGMMFRGSRFVKVRKPSWISQQRENQLKTERAIEI